MPGMPHVVIQNMPGASGVTGANWLFNIAPKDGTVVGTFSPNIAVEPLFGNAAAKYDAAAFTWIANMEESASACGLSPEAGIATFDDLLTKEVVIGAVGATGPIGQSARALNRLLGTKLKVVYGYQGTASVKIAVQRGEVKGICGLPVSTFNAFWKDMLDAGQLKYVIQLSARRIPALGSVPHIDDFIKTEEQRQVFDLIFGMQALGRIYAAPPGVPADRTRLLREGFTAAMADAGFRAAADKAKIYINPMSGEAVDALVKRFNAAPPAVIEKAKAAVRPE